MILKLKQAQQIVYVIQYQHIKNIMHKKVCYGVISPQNQAVLFRRGMLSSTVLRHLGYPKCVVSAFTMLNLLRIHQWSKAPTNYSQQGILNLRRTRQHWLISSLKEIENRGFTTPSHQNAADQHHHSTRSSNTNYNRTSTVKHHSPNIL